MTGLKKSLGRKDLIIYGLAILTPTAVYAVYGVVQQVSRGHAVLSYLAAMVAMLFTAVSYGRMASAFPQAGSTYTYARKSLHPSIGFLAGWAMILDYVLIPLLSSIFVSLTAHRLMPEIPFAAWSFLFCAIITVTNVFGIEVTKRANEIMLAIMCVSAAWFVGAALFHGAPARADAIYNPATFALQPLMLGTGIATLSYLGFDAVSTLAEDTRDPRRDIAFATVMVCLLQTAICVAIAYLATLVWPAERPVADVETVILDISRLIGGQSLFGFNTFVVIVAGVASSLASLAGASRLLYGMGRDRVLPASIFAHLHPRYATPVRSVLLMGVLSFIGSLLISFQQVVELVNFGAFAGFVLVNCSVIAHYYLRRGHRSGLHFLTNLVFPAIGALVCIYIWLSLSKDAKTTGFLWLGIGVIYLAFLTKGFRKPLEKTWELPS
ncbi:APC family permease [Bryobacter aggregatus]|uniref:APC family permease n=1 Tax=Bryobacter aggregatus TaxID=360054 RepID=UPI00068D9550|nr:APC family permease [Bryobacter aggregatus]